MEWIYCREEKKSNIKSIQLENGVIMYAVCYGANEQRTKEIICQMCIRINKLKIKGRSEWFNVTCYMLFIKERWEMTMMK